MLQPDAARSAASSAAWRITAAAGLVATATAFSVLSWASHWNAYLCLLATFSTLTLWIVFRLSLAELLRGWHGER